MLADSMIRELSDAVADKPIMHYADIEQIFIRNIDALITLLSMVTGKEEGWIKALNDREGQLLVMTFWTVNSGFFTRRLVTNIQSELSRFVAPHPSGFSTH